MSHVITALGTAAFMVLMFVAGSSSLYSNLKTSCEAIGLEVATDILRDRGLLEEDEKK